MNELYTAVEEVKAMKEKLDLEEKLLVWFYKNPKQDSLSIEYLYNFARNMHQPLIVADLETALKSLHEQEAIKLDFYPSGSIDVIRGLTSYGKVLGAAIIHFTECS